MDAKEQELIEARDVACSKLDEASRKRDEASREMDEASREMDEAYHKLWKYRESKAQ